MRPDFTNGSQAQRGQVPSHDVDCSVEPVGGRQADIMRHYFEMASSALFGARSAGAVTHWATGSSSGAGGAACFSQLAGLAMDSGGSAYITDPSDHTVCKITPDGVAKVLAGPGTLAHFASPSNIAVDHAGNLYVVDERDLYKIAPTGRITSLELDPAIFAGPTVGLTTIEIVGDSIVASTGNAIVLLRHRAQ